MTQSDTTGTAPTTAGAPAGAVAGMPGAAPVPPSPTTSRRRRYSTRTILTAVALGAAVGVVLIPLNFVSQPLSASLPMVAVIVYGVWGMSSLVPMALLQRGGTGIIGGTAAGVVTVVSPYGVGMVVMMLLWGVFMELPFLVTRYRRWGWGMFLVAGLVTGVLSCAMSIVSLDLTTLGTGMAVGICAVQLASFVVCSLGSLAIARAVSRAGVSGGRREGAARA